MTELSLVEQAERFLEIKDEDGADWKTHAPEKFRSIYGSQGISMREYMLVTLFAFVVLVIAAVFASTTLSATGTTILMGFVLITWAVFIFMRHRSLERKFKTERDNAVEIAKEDADTYVFDRCEEEGIDLTQLRKWVGEREEEAELVINLAGNGIRPIG